jgi:hypothetical protein
MSLAATTIWEWLNQTPVGDRAPLAVAFSIFFVLLVIVITVITSKTAYRIHKNRMEDSLKRELVDRGFSVEEIERIVRASAGGERGHKDT